MSYIGVDLHQNSVTTCRLETDGSEAVESWALTPDDDLPGTCDPIALAPD